MKDSRRHQEKIRGVPEPYSIRPPPDELLTDATLVVGEKFMHFAAVDRDIKNCESGQWFHIS